MSPRILPAEGESTFRLLEEGASLAGELDDAEAAARCMNFIVRSFEETPRGVSADMVGNVNL